MYDYGIYYVYCNTVGGLMYMYQFLTTYVNFCPLLSMVNLMSLIFAFQKVNH